MSRYLLFVGRRLLPSIPAFIGVPVVVFVMIHLVPGDPARTALGVHATPHTIAVLHHQWGLDRPLPIQYLLFLERLLGGDLGTSLHFGQAAATLITERLQVTIWLIVYSSVLACLISLPLALWAASKPGALRGQRGRVGS